MKKIYLSLIAVFICFTLYADVTLPKFFSDNMVLQRNKSIPIWGWATPNEKITVQFNQQTKKVKAGKNGKWMVKLDNEAAGGPYQLVIKGKNVVTISNVLVGEVWICSGQSNMEMPIAGWGKIDDYEKEISEANYPMIRHFKVPRTISSKPMDDVPGGVWETCSPATAGEFTAVGYFFARELYKKLNVPVGLLNTSWGGTMVETWISKEAFEKSDEFKNMIADMPSLDIDSLAKAQVAANKKRLETLQGTLDNAKPETWKDVATSDSQWPQMSLPGFWEKGVIGNLDGVIWFRKTIDVSRADAGKPASLSLGMIDDKDITYVNGVKVGSTDAYNVERKYAIPAGILKEGKNTIAVRVDDTGGDGGMYSDASALLLSIGERAVPLSGNWHFRIERIAGGAVAIGPNSYPTLLYNAMINPLIPYAMEGAIWYQGESNAGRAKEYSQSFPLMINDWRSRWGQNDFPFYFVQLSSFNASLGDAKKGSTWAELREAQTQTLSLPNTGMAVTTDIGNPTDIHPKNKQDVGKRLAAIALNKVYDQNNVYSGPMYENMKTNGNKITINFTSTGGGLMLKDKYGYLKGFAIAGADQQFYYAKAVIENNSVVVYSDSVANPVAVRYGWADEASDANLFNKEGFPASPFRTDNWKGITEGVKYLIRK